MQRYTKRGTIVIDASDDSVSSSNRAAKLNPQVGHDESDEEAPSPHLLLKNLGDSREEVCWP